MTDFKVAKLSEDSTQLLKNAFKTAGKIVNSEIKTESEIEFKGMYSSNFIRFTSFLLAIEEYDIGNLEELMSKEKIKSTLDLLDCLVLCSDSKELFEILDNYEYILTIFTFGYIDINFYEHCIKICEEKITII